MSSGVIVGYDGSDCAKTALTAAVEVARAYGDKLTVVFGYELSPVGSELHDYHAALNDLGRARLEEALALLGGGDGEVEPVIVALSPAEALVHAADERDARVIVVGTQGESPIRGALLGSTAHKLLHISDRPVLVVPGNR
jgi:nucleotide-binding universal stress UspA family protein